MNKVLDTEHTIAQFFHCRMCRLRDLIQQEPAVFLISIYPTCRAAGWKKGQPCMQTAIILNNNNNNNCDQSLRATRQAIDNLRNKPATVALLDTEDSIRQRFGNLVNGLDPEKPPSISECTLSIIFVVTTLTTVSNVFFLDYEYNIVGYVGTKENVVRVSNKSQNRSTATSPITILISAHQAYQPSCHFNPVDYGRLQGASALAIGVQFNRSREHCHGRTGSIPKTLDVQKASICV